MRARIGKKEEVARLVVLLPESLHAYLAESARQSNRSINYEVVVRLQASIELDRLVKLENTEEKLVALTKLKSRLVDLRLVESDD